LLSNGELGVWRWPIRFDPERAEYRIGPPHPLPLPGSNCWIDEDDSGRIVALADHQVVYVLTPERELRVGPLDDCRAVAVSPGGEWLATGSHHGASGAQVWRARDATPVAHLAIEGSVGVRFSPDGKWLMTTAPPCRLWAVGTWREARQLGGAGLCFSPDGRLLVFQDASKVLHLVETETDRTLARLESPDSCAAWWATFSPDGSRLVLTTNEGPAVHVWDLRGIRRHLAELDLDWDATSLPDSEASPRDTQDRTLLKADVDFGPLKRYSEQYQSHLEQYAVPAEEIVARYTALLRADPADPGSIHQRGHALLRLNRFDEALDDFSGASARRPLDAHLRAYHGVCLLALQRYTQALDQLEPAFAADPESVRAIIGLDEGVNNLAWVLATGAQRNPELAARLAAFSVALSPDKEGRLNTLGVALYRAGRFAEAIETLEKSLKAGKGWFDGFDLFFLAMAHHRLGHGALARACFGHAVHWLGEQKTLSGQHTRDLAAFRAEAESLLRSPIGELPSDVFSRPR
jgi:tetratricopeptide (TPR) repeat protein